MMIVLMPVYYLLINKFHFTSEVNQKSFQSIQNNYGRKVNLFLPIIKYYVISYLTLAEKSY